MTTDHLLYHIATGTVRLALDRQDRLLVADLSAVVPGNNGITVRDLIRMVFAELGIEIEFSGKNGYEKGVIIDVDEDRVNELQLSRQALKPGQTVVRVGAGDIETVETPHNGKYQPLDEKITIAVRDALQKAKYQ